MGFFRGLFYLGAAILLFFMVASGFHAIPHGQVGVVLVNVGDRPVLEEVLDPGWYWRRPFVVQVETYPTTREWYDVQHNVTDRNRRSFELHVRVGYAIDRGKVVALFRTIGSHRALEQAIQQRATEVIGAVAATWDRDAAYDRRQEFAGAIKDNLAGRLPAGVTVHEVSLESVTYPEDYRNAIDALPVRAALETLELTALSAEKRVLVIRLGTVYRVDPARVVEVAGRLGKEYRETMLQPLIQAQATALAAGRPADEIFAPAGRDAFATALRTRLAEELGPQGLLVDKVTVIKLEFDPTVMAQVRDREQQAVALAGMDLKLKMAEREVAVERVRKDEQSRARLASAGIEAKARTIEAASAKESAIIKAEGDKEALSRVVELIEKNPRLLDYLSVSRLSDKVQVIVAPPGSGLSSFLPQTGRAAPAPAQQGSERQP